ncbi:MAG: OmpA family protein [Candidatus Deferrimicrobium sp.]|nr:OmpA family protein [Candidatus Deferrimicrobium sp.]
MNQKGDLPKKFTVEFDAILGNNGKRGLQDKKEYTLLLAKGKALHWAGDQKGSFQFSHQDGHSKNSKTGIDMNDDKVHHIAVSVNGTFAKGYVDNIRVINDPDGIERPIERVGIYMGLWSGRSENLMITNFRLAEGGKDVKSALDTDGRIVTHGILFDTGKDTIKPESLPTLKMILALLKDDPGMKFSIEGHTDSQGSNAINQPLSGRRSAAVKNWLAGKGIDPLRLTTKGFGDTMPIDTNKTPEGRANNRRVEFVKF